MPINTARVCGRQTRRTVYCLPLIAAAVFSAVPGCGSRQAASHADKPDSVSLRKVAERAPKLADNARDTGASEAKETRLDLRLNRTEIDPDSNLSGTISGSPGDSQLTLLWVDGANRVIGVFNVTPAKEKRGDPIAFSIPFPKTSIGQLHRLLLVRGSAEDQKKNPLQLDGQALFHVRTPAAWDDYVAMVRGIDGLDEAGWERLRQAGISGGSCAASDMPGQLVRRSLPYCSDLFQPAENPFGVRDNWAARVANFIKSPSPELLQRDPPLFDETALAKDFQHIDSTLAARHGFVPLGWSLGKNLSLTCHSAPFDYDMSPSTIQVFQGWLEKRYGTLEVLNRQWGTSYKSWDDVRPQTTDAVLNFKRGAPAAPVAAMAPDSKDPKTNTSTSIYASKLPEPTAPRLPGGENFAAWSDFRTFSDYSFARVLREYRSKLIQGDPLAHPGLVGVPAPSVFGGWDYWQVAKLVDWAEEHESSQARALMRQFAPQLRWISQVSGNNPAHIYGLWDRWLGGDFGCVIDAKTLDQETPELSTELKFISSGITRLRETAETVTSPVAIYYSPRAMQVQWLLDCKDAGSDWLLRDSAYEAKHNSALLDLKAWSMLLEDVGYSPRYVYPNDVLAGTLSQNKVKVLILPKVLALSDAEAVALRQFALNGGVIVADGACGTFDGSGRRRSNDASSGVLDGDFGIARKDLRINELNGQFLADPADARVTMRDGINKPAIGPESSELRALEPGIVVRGGRAHAWSAGGTAALLNKSAGVGRFIYLNLSLQNYPLMREGPMADDFLFHGISGPDYVKKWGTPTGGEALRLVIGDILADSLPANPLHVWSLDGTPLRGIKRSQYFLGKDSDVFVVLPIGQIDQTHAAITGESITEPTPIWVGLDRPRHWFDVRTGSYLGWGASVKVTADPARPLILSALPYQTDRINLKVGRTDPRGLFKVHATLMASLEPVVHVFHIEVTDPDGKVLRHYTQNVVAEGGKWNTEFALGVNEPAGRYHLIVRDVATGATGIGDLLKDFSDYAEVVKGKEKE